MSSDVLVIGFGSLIRGDDAAGPLAAERLVDRLPNGAAEVLVRHVLTPDLVEPISRASLVVFLDATTDRPAGRVDERPVTAADDGSLALVHQLEPADLLAWAKLLYGRVPLCHLVTIGVETLEFADAQLSPAVADGLEHMIARVEQLVMAHAARHSMT